MKATQLLIVDEEMEEDKCHSPYKANHMGFCISAS